MAFQALRGGRCWLHRARVLPGLPCLPLETRGWNTVEYHTLQRPRCPHRKVPPLRVFPQCVALSTTAALAKDIMEFPHVQRATLGQTLRNWFLSWFVIKPYLDPNFGIWTFLDGATEAILIISEKMSEGDFAGLRGLVTPEALAEIERSVAPMSLKERCELKVLPRNIGHLFLVEIGMIIEEEEDVQKRWVEITVCAYVHPYFAREILPHEPDFERCYEMADFTVCNYRFIRNYTKGVKDSWTANVVNHFKPNLHLFQ